MSGVLCYGEALIDFLQFQSRHAGDNQLYRVEKLNRPVFDEENIPKLNFLTRFMK